jgi:hypothetical protein
MPTTSQQENESQSRTSARKYWLSVSAPLPASFLGALKRAGIRPLSSIEGGSEADTAGNKVSEEDWREWTTCVVREDAVSRPRNTSEMNSVTPTRATLD